MCPDVLDIVKQAGHIKDGDIRQESNLRCRILYDKRNITILTGFQKLTVAAQNTVRINLDSHFSVGKAGHFFRKTLSVDLGYSILGARGSKRPGISLCLTTVFTASGQRQDQNNRRCGAEQMFHFFHNLPRFPLS